MDDYILTFNGALIHIENVQIYQWNKYMYKVLVGSNICERSEQEWGHNIENWRRENKLVVRGIDLAKSVFAKKKDAEYAPKYFVW